MNLVVQREMYSWLECLNVQQNERTIALLESCRMNYSKNTRPESAQINT